MPVPGPIPHTVAVPPTDFSLSTPRKKLLPAVGPGPARHLPLGGATKGVPPMNPSSRRFVLHNLPLASRLVISAALVWVGIGYCAALAQIHFQHAPAGKLLPGPKEVAGVYHGQSDMSPLERLLVADENRPFNGGGSMSQAFTTR